MADTGNDRIQKFDSSGVFVTKWGGPGYGIADWQFTSPYGIAIDASGNVYVADTENDRIQKFKHLLIPTKAGMETFATRFYQYFLGRPPDAGGLDYWSNLMVNKTKFPVDVALDFMYSQEFTRMNTTNSQFVDVLYRAIMGREADSGGKTYWVGVLDNGTARADVLRSFANSQEFSNLCTNYGITPFDYTKDFG